MTSSSSSFFPKATMAKVQAAFGAAGQPGLIYPFDVRSFQTLYAEVRARVRAVQVATHERVYCIN